jgi:hypothetical protein
MDFFGETVYSFTCDDCHFAVLDSGLMTDEQEQGDQDAAAQSNELLGQFLSDVGDAPAAVFIHMYIYPPGIEGYSMRSGDQAIAMLEDHPRPVPVINGHHHPGRMSVIRGVPYFTARSFTEKPWAFLLHELTETGLTVTEYVLDMDETDLREEGQSRGREICRFESRA